MKFLTTSAIALILSAPMAFAEAHVSEDETAMEEDQMMMEDDSTTMGDDTAMEEDMAMNEDMDITDMSDGAMLIRSRDITGGEIYTMNQADDEGWDPEFMFDTVDANWNQIGTIEDLVLSPEGQIVGIVAEIGGFLDIGDKHVVLSVDDLNLVAIDDTRYTYVTRYSEEQLEELPGVDEAFWQ